MSSVMQRAIRSIQTAADCCPRLTRFSLHAPKTVEVEFANGSVYNLSAEFLRVHSPAADSKIRSIGGEKVIFGRRYVGIMSAEPVGNYGVRLLFDDLHKTGIYTWEYFYHLGEQQVRPHERLYPNSKEAWADTGSTQKKNEGKMQKLNLAKSSAG